MNNWLPDGPASKGKLIEIIRNTGVKGGKRGGGGEEGGDKNTVQQLLLWASSLWRIRVRTCPAIIADPTQNEPTTCHVTPLCKPCN